MRSCFRLVGPVASVAVLFAACGGTPQPPPCVLDAPNSLSITGDTDQNVSASTLWLRDDQEDFLRLSYLVSATSPATQYQYEVTTFGDGGAAYELGSYEIQSGTTLRLYPLMGSQSRFDIATSPDSACRVHQLVLSCATGADCGRNDLVGTYTRQ